MRQMYQQANPGNIPGQHIPEVSSTRPQEARSLHQSYRSKALSFFATLLVAATAAAQNTPPPTLSVDLGQVKGKVSPALYVIGIALTFIAPWLGLVPFVVVALIWLVPEPRVESYLAEHGVPEEEA